MFFWNLYQRELAAKAVRETPGKTGAGYVMKDMKISTG